MATNDVTVWGIHAGSHGEAHTLFMRKNVIALGWTNVGDLSLLSRDRDTYKAKLVQQYPDTKPGAVSVNAGQLFRFVNEIKIGDLVVYPSKEDRKIHIGRIEGVYQYTPNLDSHYVHTRSVKWLKELPRINFSQGALYEIGSAMGLFQVRNYSEEFINALETKDALLPPNNDETVALVVDDIEETTRDFILKQLSREMKGHPLEHFIGHLLGAMGYHTRITKEGTDSGIDIIAHKDELGLEPPIIKVQVKSSDGRVGEPEVSQLYGKVGTGEFGLFITLATFSNQAKSFARNKTNLRLVDGDELVELVLQHYEKFDSRYKGLIPLKRVYIPAALKELEE